MRLPLLAPAGVLLLALLPGPPCGALRGRGPVPGARPAPQLPPPLGLLQPPLLLRVGEEYFLRLGSLGRSPAAPLPPASAPPSRGGGARVSPDEAAADLLRALPQPPWPPRRRLDSPAGPERRGAESDPGGRQEAPEREKRSEEAPISLDLTFHLLREVLEMARAEQLAQQAHSNRKLMEIIGK